MRILIQDRPDAAHSPGGDSVVVRETAAFLASAGHRVEVSTASDPDLDRFDVVHLFNLTRPHDAWHHARRARERGKPYLLTPIYWDLVAAIPWYAYERPRCWRIRLTPPALRYGRLARGGDERPRQAETLRHARFVLPASQAEADHLRTRFPHALERDRILVSPHGVDPPTVSRRAPEKTTSLVCAGGIGPRKNQLGLVAALRGSSSLDLQIVGNPAPGSARYLRATRRLAGPEVRFEPAVEPERMGDVLGAARALVQPSFVETPGLAALEARSLGLPVVVSALGPVREAFGDDPRVFYCDPGSAASIRQACEGAARAEPGGGERFAAPRKWSILLQPLAQAYERLEGELAERQERSTSP